VYIFYFLVVTWNTPLDIHPRLDDVQSWLFHVKLFVAIILPRGKDTMKPFYTLFYIVRHFIWLMKDLIEGNL